MLEQDRVRDYGFALSWQRKIEGLLPQKDGMPSPPLTISFDLSVNFLKETKETQVIGQLRFGLPLTQAFQLPVSLSYASKTKMNLASGFLINVGIGLDGGILGALSQLRASQ